MKRKDKSHFENICSDIFNTPNGQILLKYWKQMYVECSCVRETPEMTYYHLGQKEFVQALINTLENEEVLQDIELPQDEFIVGG